MTKRLLYGITALAFVSCAGCPLWWENPVDVVSDIVFHEDAWYGINSKAVVSDGVLYFTSMDMDAVSAYDLQSHRYLWKTSGIILGDPFVEGDPCVGSDSVYIASSSFRDSLGYDIIELNKATGLVTRRIAIYSSGQPSYVTSTSLGYYGSRLFFIDHYGFGSIDVSTLSLNGSGLYEGEVERVLSFSEPDLHYGISCAFEGSLASFSWYFRDYYWPDDTRFGELIGVDMDTRKVIWKQPGLGGKQCIIGGMVFYTPVASKSQVSFVDARSGAIKATNFDCYGSSQPPVIDTDGGRFYSVTSAYPDVGPKRKSIYCLDLTTAKEVWTRPVEESDGIGSVRGVTPQVHDGILYVPNAEYLELFDAETGELLGRDRNVWGDGWNLGHTVKYGDVMVVSSGTQMWGVRMNWKRGPSGLYK